MMPEQPPPMIAEIDRMLRNFELNTRGSQPSVLRVHPADWCNLLIQHDLMQLQACGVQLYPRVGSVPTIMGVPVQTDPSIPPGQVQIQHEMTASDLFAALTAASVAYEGQAGSYPRAIYIGVESCRIISPQPLDMNRVLVLPLPAQHETRPWCGDPTDLDRIPTVPITIRRQIPTGCFALEEAHALRARGARVRPDMADGFEWLEGDHGGLPCPHARPCRPDSRCDCRPPRRDHLDALRLYLDRRRDTPTDYWGRTKREPFGELGGDIVEDIDALIAENDEWAQQDQLIEQTMKGREKTGAATAQCPNPACNYRWHGLPITTEMLKMRIIGAYVESYDYWSDTSAVLCAGSGHYE
jgi:hypothetical protein